jgi:hypothetical protein
MENTKESAMEKETKVVELGAEKPKELDPELQKKLDFKKNELEEKKKEYEDFKTEVSNKKYAVKIGSESVFTQLKDFMMNEAEWKGTEAIGVEKVNEELSKSEVKSKATMLNSNVIEAIFYFMSKVTKKGNDEAKEFSKIFKPINDSLGLTRADQDEIKKKETMLGMIHQQVAALEQGLDIDQEIPEETTTE